jgi:hypothetical protein
MQQEVPKIDARQCAKPLPLQDFALVCHVSDLTKTVTGRVPGGDYLPGIGANNARQAAHIWIIVTEKP